jgi:transcriptional regulator with XRE-family HTH domain
VVNEDREASAQAFHDLLRLSRLPQHVVAERLGVSRQAIYEWKTGQAPVAVEALLALARLAHRSVRFDPDGSLHIDAPADAPRMPLRPAVGAEGRRIYFKVIPGSLAAVLGLLLAIWVSQVGLDAAVHTVQVTARYVSSGGAAPAPSLTSSATPSSLAQTASSGSGPKAITPESVRQVRPTQAAAAATPTALPPLVTPPPAETVPGLYATPAPSGGSVTPPPPPPPTPPPVSQGALLDALPTPSPLASPVVAP